MDLCVHFVVSPGQITVTSHVTTCMSANRRVAIGSRAREDATWSLTSKGSMGSTTGPKAKRSRPCGNTVFQNKRGPVASVLPPFPRSRNV